MLNLFPLYINIILFTKTLLKAQIQYIKSELKAAKHYTTDRKTPQRTMPHRIALLPSVPNPTARYCHAVPYCTVPYPTVPYPTIL